MPSGEFDVTSSVGFEDRLDGNGNSYPHVKTQITTVDRALWSAETPFAGLNGMSSDAVVISQGGRFQFGIRLFLGETPTKEYVTNLDKAIPPEIPTNIPFVLEGGLRVKAGSDPWEERDVLVRGESNSELAARGRRYYIYNPMLRPT